MLKLLKGHKGSIGIALVVAIIAILSGASLASVGFRDVRSARLQLDALQKFHFLRSEVSRARSTISYFEGQGQDVAAAMYLPERRMNVAFGDHRTQYRAKTKVEAYTAFDHSGYLIRSQISGVRGSGQIMSDETNSPVKRYGENFIRSLQTLAIFHYFSDIDRALDDVEGNIRFYGQDVIYGRVHSNSDIWIRQIGGGSNSGWPTFHGLVSTAGEIQVYGGGNYPEDDVFRGGLIENYPRVVFEPSAQLVRQNGIRLLPGEHDDKVVIVTLNGLAYNAMVGDIIDIHPPEQFTIYDSYPPYGPVGDSIGVNIITMQDTVWTPQNGTLQSGQSVFVGAELWISGMAGGEQTWASSHDVFIKDDIYYQNTTIGQPPDGGPEGLYPVNTRDYFGLISEESLYIQYGYYCPVDEIRKKPNTSNIYMYGAFVAMGDGEGETTGDGIHHKDGIFTFQYQFPKGSTPDQIWMGEVPPYTMIDLHRFKYPTSPFEPWPPGLDYPWYNPIWPEPGPVFDHPPIPNPHGAPLVSFLRGTIYLYGSVAQRRRGFVRRSGNSDYDTDYWDLEGHKFGRHTGTPSGYDKHYTFDTRFESKGPPDFPLVKFEGYESDEMMDLGYETISWIFKNPRQNF